MDGVLVDSEPLHEKAQDIVCRKFDLNVPKTVNPMFKGWTEEKVYEYITEHFGTDGSTSVEHLVKEKHAAYASLSDELQLIPGALHLVQSLHEKSIPLGLVTSATKADQERTFTKFGFALYFSAVTTIEDVRLPKPDPQPYIITAARLGVPVEECIVIEDSKYGILSGLRAGCHVLGLTTTFTDQTLKDVGAHAVFKSNEEINQYLSALLSPTSGKAKSC